MIMILNILLYYSILYIIYIYIDIELFLQLHVSAIRRFYQTKSEEEHLKQRGKYDRKVTLQRRTNRLNRVSPGYVMYTSTYT